MKSKSFDKNVLNNSKNSINPYIKTNKDLVLERRKSFYREISEKEQEINKYILENLIPKSIQRTLKKFQDDIQIANIEVEKKNKTKKIIQEKKKNRIQQILNKKIGEEEPIGEKSSDSELNSSDEKINLKQNDENKINNNALTITNIIEKKPTGYTDKKTCEEEIKKNAEFHELTFSVNTSDGSSYCYGYINETLVKEKKFDNSEEKENDKNIKEKEFDKFYNVKNKTLKTKLTEKIKTDIKEKYSNNDINGNQNNENSNSKGEELLLINKFNTNNKIEETNREKNLNVILIKNKRTINNCIIESDEKPSSFLDTNNLIKRDIILTKKTLVDKQNDLYNKMIITKPDNPMISLPKYREGCIIKKKKDNYKILFDPNDIIDERKKKNFLIKRLKKDYSFLNFLKNTQEGAEKYRPLTIDEIIAYENQLEDQSLDISKEANDPALIITDNSEIENLSSLTDEKNYMKKSGEKENKRIEELVCLNKKFDMDQYKNFNQKKNLHRSSMNSKESLNLNLINKIKRLDLLSDFYGTSIDSFNKLNIIMESNSSRQKEGKDKEKKKFFDKQSNINLIKYDNDLVINLYMKIDTTRKLVKKRSFSVNKNECKFPDLITNQNENFKNINNIDKIKTLSAFNTTKNKEIIKPLNKNKINNNAFDVLKAKNKDHYSNYRKYMKYLNFIINKDFKVKDNFSADDFLHDVMGKSENLNSHIKKNLELDPVKIFNKKNLNLKTNQYVKYKNIPILESHLVEIKSNLKNLPIEALNSMNGITKNFRCSNINNKSYFNKDDINRGSKVITVDGNPYTSLRSKKFLHKSFLTKNNITELTTFHKSYSIISSSNTKNLKNDTLKEIKFNLENTLANTWKDFINLPDNEKINKFFEKDIFQKMHENEKNNTIAKIIIDTDFNRDDIKNKIEKIRSYDMETNTLKYKEWSAHQVMMWKEDPEKYYIWNKLITDMEDINVIIWSENNTIECIFERIRYIFFVLSTNVYFEGFILFIVIFNITSMLLSGNLLTIEEQQIIKYLNLTFNVIFIFEFFCKFIGLGPIIYFSDAFTWLDLLIISLAILDLTNLDVDEVQILQQKNRSLSSQFGFFKVFRIFRVLRIAKVLRRIKSFRKIIVGIKNSLSNVAYNSLILLIFIIIFQLLGMSFLNENKNYQSFFSSFYITFQLLTIENWNSVLFELSEFNRLAVLYLITLIFFGNYILFNLFISILLNSFDGMADISEEESEIYDKLPEEFAKYEIMDRELKFLLKRGKKDQVKSNDLRSTHDDKSNSDDSSEEENFMGNNTLIRLNYSNLSGIRRLNKEISVINYIFRSNECEYSLYIFSQKSSVRLFFKNLVSLKKFDSFILIMILLSTITLIIDTFLSGASFAMVFDIIDIFFTIVFLFEMVAKIISLGFALDEGSYLKDNWNRIDFIIVIVSLIDLQNLISKFSGNVSNSSFNFLKVLRLLRTLRPLRFISHNVQLKIIITALFDSIGPISNVLVIVFIILLIFSIVGMTLFYELYHTCYVHNDITPFAAIKNFTDYLDFANPSDYSNIQKLQEKVKILILFKKYRKIFNKIK